MVSIGLRPRVKKKAHLASCLPMLLVRVTAPVRRSPYHGYYYNILTKQGPAARAALRTNCGRQDDRRLCAGGLSGSVP